MKAKEKKVTVKNRKPYEHLSERKKRKIVHEINSGLIGQRAAVRKYGLNRNTLNAWITNFSSFNIKPHVVAEEAISDMTQSGSPYDNALAERVNGIIKNEFYPKRIYQNHKEASKAISKIIQIYNSKRPHASINYLTPDQAYTHEGLLSKRWKSCRRKKNSQVEPIELLFHPEITLQDLAIILIKLYDTLFNLTITLHLYFGIFLLNFHQFA